MKMIVAVDNNWAIGSGGGLLAHLPTDLRKFKEITEGNVVVMGRKTFESLPNKPLKNRHNIVLTTNPNFKYEDVISLDADLPDLIKYFNYLETINKQIFIIGGQSVYEQFLPYVNTVYVTKIDYGFIDIDTFFPNLDEDESWGCNYIGNPIEENGYSFIYTEYVKVGEES